MRQRRPRLITEHVCICTKSWLALILFFQVFWHASKEGLIRNGSSTHAGIRTRLASLEDYSTDRNVGFSMQEANVIVSTKSTHIK